VNIQITETQLAGVLVIEPNLFEDERGWFTEFLNTKVWKENNLSIEFAQENLSYSKQGTIRGLHFQNPPFGQAKLVTVFNGAVQDIVVDIRKNSATYLQHIAIQLNGEKPTWIFIPEGFAHGFEVLSESATFYYKCSNFYNKESESGLLYNEQELNINWKTKNPIISDKDLLLPKLNEFITYY